jgi:hypothetical protein
LELDWMLAWSVRLYPMINPRTTMTAMIAANHVQIVPAVLDPWRSTRRNGSVRRESV